MGDYGQDGGSDASWPHDGWGASKIEKRGLTIASEF